MTRQGGLAVCWAVVGMLLCAPLVQPYADDGPLSRSSAITTVRVLRDTGVADALPHGAAWVLVVMPLAGLALLATATWRVRTGLRAAVLALAALSLVAVVDALGIVRPGGWGTAVWSGALGLVAGCLTLAASTRSTTPFSERTFR